MRLAKNSFNDMHNKLALPEVEILTIGQLWEVRDIFGAKREPFSIGLHCLEELSHCFHYIVLVHSLATVLSTVAVANPFSEASYQPGILFWLLPNFVAVIVERNTCGKGFVNFVTLFNYITRQKSFFIEYMDAVSKVNTLLNLSRWHKIR